jgi:hypothetical protein
MLMRRAARRIADERGQSLVLALLVLTVLAITLGSVIFFTASNQRSSSYQKAAQVATSLAEAGVNNAVSVLANPANSCCLEQPWGSGTTAVLPDNSVSHPAYTTTYPGGTGDWWGNLKQSTEVYTVHGKATVPNPTGGSPIVKYMSANVQVNQPKPGTIQVGVWNSIYSPFGPSSGCDTTVAQGVNMNVPLYVGGNLCLANGALVNAPTYVGGFLYVNNKQAGIGTSSTPVTSRAQAGANPVHVGSYCQVQNGGTQVNPCAQEPHNPSTNVFLSMSGAWNPQVLKANMPDFASVTAPEICWAASSNCPGDLAGGWYNVASPGPLHPCQTVSGTPPVFDNTSKFGPDEGLPGGSVAASFNLTPATSYTCKTAQGELSWNAATRVLTVYGTIFIDGSVYAANASNAPITYTGWGSCTTTVPCDGVVYVTGTVYINGEKLCAQVNAGNTDCDWTNWDPNKKILVFLADYQGTQTGVGAGQGIVVGPTQTSFQGGLYATYQVNTGQGAATQGPLVSGTQTVVTGQQFQGSFPAINILPISIQGPPQAFYIGSPFNYCYGASCPAGT